MPTQVVHDEWEVYSVGTDKGPIFISFDVGAAREDLSAQLPHCARVLIPIQAPNDNGGPVEPESGLLWQMEDSLCETLAEHGVQCRLVGRLTHQGTRELVYYLADWDTFRAPVGLWMQQHSDYEIDVSEHEGWGFFHDCIRPTPEDWLFIADRNVVEKLIESGSNPEKEHALEFVFIGESAGLGKIETVLRGRGYFRLAAPGADAARRANSSPAADAKTLVMVRKMPLDLSDIFETSLGHAKLAQEIGVTYDGWGCEIVR